MEWIQDGERLTVTHRGRVLIQHDVTSPWLTVGQGTASYEMHKGNFAIHDNLLEKVALVYLKADTDRSSGAETLHLTAAGRGDVIVHVDISTTDTGDVQFVFHPQANPDALLSLNRLWLAVPATPEEAVFGCGEQFSHFNLRGKKFPLWVSEQGGGRNKKTYETFLADSQEGAGGDYYTTYFPQPTFISSQKYYLHVEDSHYTNRFYVQAAVYDEFVEGFAARVKQMHIGNPLGSEPVDLGPMIDAGAATGLQQLSMRALALGAQNVCEGISKPGLPAYLAPQILVDVPTLDGFATSELFGPAAPIFRFEDDEEGMTLANQGDMGLAAYAFTESLSHATRVSEALLYGIVGLNHALPSVAFAPMGGFRMSGLGREGGRIGLEEFQEVKYVSALV